MNTFGIDISKWQGNYNIASAVASGVEFIILKIGGADKGLYKDPKFDTYYAECKRLGVPVGAYFYGNEFSVEKAVQSAQYVMSLLKGKQFEYPIYYDVEGSMVSRNNKSMLTEIVDAFCSEVQNGGYYTGIYSSEAFFKEKMDDSKLQKYTHWVAKWSKSQPSINCDMWQFGGESNFIRSTYVAGQIVDQDYCFKDFSTIIKNAGLNGYEKPETEVEEAPETAIIINDLNKVITIDGTIPLYRMYNPNSGEHFYALQYEEANAIYKAGWKYEGVAFYAREFGTPVYRAYNPVAGDHHYTANKDEINMLVDVGWINEGIAFNSGGDVPVYRLYNKNAKSGAHHFTCSDSEKNYLVSQGWVYEGIAFYVARGY